MTQDLSDEDYHAYAHEITDACGFYSLAIFAITHFKEYLTKPFGQHHDVFLNAVTPGEKGVKWCILAPRESSKSACMSTFYITHSLYYKEVYERLDLVPYHYILVITNTKHLSSQRVSAIRNKILDHPPFQYLIGKDWAGSSIKTSNDTLLESFSRGTQLRGISKGENRPDLIICDDIDDYEDMRNHEIRTNNLDWFDKTLLPLGDPSNLNIILIETLKHEESIAGHKSRAPDWKSYTIRAIEHPEDIEHPTAEGLWREFEQIYIDTELSYNERMAQSTQFYEDNKEEMMEGVIEMWGSKMPYLKIRQMCCSRGKPAVLQEYQNICRDPSQTLFDMDNAMRFDVVSEGFLKENKHLVQWDELTGATIFLDWMGGKDAQENAYAAIVSVVYYRPAGIDGIHTETLMDGVQGFVYKADLFRDGLDVQINRLIDMYQTVKAEVKSRNFKIQLGIEDFVKDTADALTQATLRHFIAERERRGLTKNEITLQFLPRRTVKETRIDALQPLIKNKWLIFNNKLDSIFMRQMRNYPIAEFLDAPDALQGACELRITRFESEREATRKHRREQERQFKVQI